MVRKINESQFNIAKQYQAPEMLKIVKHVIYMNVQSKININFCEINFV
jgi:hypothetical protein